MRLIRDSPHGSYLLVLLYIPITNLVIDKELLLSDQPSIGNISPIFPEGCSWMGSSTRTLRSWLVV